MFIISPGLNHVIDNDDSTQRRLIKMKRRLLVAMLICLISLYMLAGCGQEGSADSPDAAKKEETAAEEEFSEETEEADAAEETEDATVAEESDETGEISETSESIPSLSKEQCEEEIGKLLEAEPVHPDNLEGLRRMVDCATCSGSIDKSCVIFSEMDNDHKARLRFRFLEAVMYENSPLYEDITIKLDDDRWGVPVEEAKKLFLDAYGDGEFTPAEYERVEDGYIIVQFADGDPVDLLVAVQCYEDDDYILLTGPMFYESNGEGERFEGCADVLFSKNPDSRFRATLLYGRLRDADIKISAVETSSELPASGGRSYSGDNLTDGDPSTVWAEGVSGTGVGETITLHLDKKQPVYGIQIINGYTAGYEQYNNNGMLTDIDVDFGGGAHAEGHYLEGYGSENFSPQDLADMNRFRIGLDEPVVTDTVTITITGAKKGAKYDDTCVSDILVYGP